MSEMQCTSGPWEFRVYSHGCIVVSAHNEPGRSTRAWLKGVEVRVDADIADDQSNATDASPDALLIRAAPSMFEVLVELADHPKLHREEIEMIQATIAKARGKP